MKQLFYFAILSFFIFPQVNAQDMASTLPYQTIPEYPAKYNAATVTARMIDGLGYRYYWATEELRTEDLTYRPSLESRTTEETLEHIYSLSNTILNAVLNKANIRPSEENELSFEEKRKATLTNFKADSDMLRQKKNKHLKKMNIAFQRGEKKSEFPFWHNFNGPIADALWHTGQIVSFRRAAGNPINPKINVFTGKTRE